MTIAHKITLFGIVLHRLAPYQNRMKPCYELTIDYKSYTDLTSYINVQWYSYKNGSISNLQYRTFKFEYNVSINDFVDEIIKALKPYIN